MGKGKRKRRDGPPPKKGREKEGEDRAREGETEEERTSIPLLPTLHVSSSIFHFTSNSKGAELYMSGGREGWKRKCVFNWVNFVTNTTQAHLPPSPRSRRPLLAGQAPVQIKQRKRRGTEKRAIWGIVAWRLAEHTKKGDGVPKSKGLSDSPFCALWNRTWWRVTPSYALSMLAL